MVGEVIFFHTRIGLFIIAIYIRLLTLSAHAQAPAGQATDNKVADTPWLMYQHDPVKAVGLHPLHEEKEI